MPGYIQTGRWARLVSKLFNVKGGQQGMQVLDDVLPVLPICDSTDTEYHWNREEYLWSYPISIAAGGAGTLATTEIGCSNPRYLTVIEGCILQGGPGPVDWRMVLNSGLSGATNQTPRLCDARWEAYDPPSVRVYNSNPAAGIFPGNGRGLILAASSSSIPLGIVIDGDDIVQIQLYASNLPLYGTVWGYDRLAESNELG
ncbi:MAG: hypothetical protein LLG45_13450 [Actinomycetia bacterium]|nr:hypothetical protein [Actinomycetes bacterium]